MKYLLKTCLYTTIIIALITLISLGTAGAEELIHVVGKGETIFSISRSYQVNAEELMRVNNLSDPSKLQAGKPLVIPSKGVAINTPNTSTQVLTNHRVVRGDTLYSIARNNGITVAALLELNKFSANHVIKVGDVVKIPQRGNTRTETAQPQPQRQNTAEPRLESLRWPINPREITYMTGQLGVVVKGEHFEPVTSLTQGKVISAGPWRKFGKVAIVETAGGYFYMYGGCEILSVKVGDMIGPGMELGKLGINASTEKPQLFFMVFRRNTPIDPAKAPRTISNIQT